ASSFVMTFFILRPPFFPVDFRLPLRFGMATISTCWTHLCRTPEQGICHGELLVRLQVQTACGRANNGVTVKNVA
ncbi:MAG: hypothetical protein WB818_07815, partial [Desulfobacterales bacterium]